MATKWKMKHGDSLWLDIVPIDTIDNVDPTWPGTWTGLWTAKTALADVVPVASGNLIPFDGTGGRPNIPGKFRLEITSEPTDTTPIPIGDYLLSIEIYNSLTTFRKEIAQDKLIVSQDGV